MILTEQNKQCIDKILFPGRHAKKKEFIEPINSPEIEALIKQALQISSYDWGYYYLMRDPLYGCISPKDEDMIIKGSRQCAKEIFEKVHQQYIDLSLEEIAQKLGIEIEYDWSPQSLQNFYLSIYTEKPPKIQLYTPIIQSIAEHLEKVEWNNQACGKMLLDFCLSKNRIKNLMIAHELFHHFESKEADIFTRKKHIENIRLGFWKSCTSIISASEIAANYFAQLYSADSIHPAILELLCFSITNPAYIKRLMEQVCRHIEEKQSI